MAYFTQDFIDFFQELSANNHREWFHANKKRYEQQVKVPFQSFVQLMIDRVQEVDRNVVLTPKDAIFRINRDIRFSADKTPYKTNVSAIISSGGKKDKTIPDGLYMELGPETLGIFGGAYMPDRHQVQAIRESIVTNMEEFEQILNAEDFVSRFGALQGDENKRLPKEFREPAERQPLLFKKSYYFSTRLPAEKILEPNLPDLIMEYYEAGRPVARFLAEAMSQGS